VGKSAKDFDDWFTAAGDPWNLDSGREKRRLATSLAFVCKHTPSNVEGTLIEFGPFHGHFTVQLAKAFPAATVLGLEISEVALRVARERTANLANVDLMLCDVANPQIEAIRNRRSTPVAIVALEVLYYLTDYGRTQTLNRFHDALGPIPWFVSSPIHGRDYLTTHRLESLFASAGYLCKDLDTLSLRFRLPRLSVLSSLPLLSRVLRTKRSSCSRPCLLYTSPSPRDLSTSRMPSSA